MIDEPDVDVSDGDDATDDDDGMFGWDDVEGEDSGVGPEDLAADSLEWDDEEDESEDGEAEPEEAESEPEPESDGKDKEEPEVLTLETLGDLADRKLKLTVDGEEQTVSVGEALKDAATAHQIRRSASQRMEEASAAQKKLAAAVETFREDPLRALPDSMLPKVIETLFSDQRYAGAVNKWMDDLEAERNLTPEQRQLRDLQREKEASEERLRQLEQEREEKARAQETDRHQQRFTEEFSKALEQVKLPTSPGILRRMAQLASSALDKGESIDALRLARQVNAELRSNLEQVIQSSDEETLMGLLGEKAALLKKRQAEEVARRPRRMGRGRKRKTEMMRLEDVEDMLEKNKSNW